MSERIPPEHFSIHERLTNWGRWARIHRHYGHCLSFEHRYRAPRGAEVEWETATPPPAPLLPPDTLDAMEIERRMHRLPRLRRVILKLRYVENLRDERDLSRRLHVPRHKLADHLYAARQKMHNLTNGFSENIIPFHNSGKPLSSEIRSPVGGFLSRSRYRFWFAFSFWQRVPQFVL